MKSIIKLGIALGILFVLTISIHAVQTQQTQAAGPWYVANGGSDTNDCLSPGSPCANVTTVIDKAGAGDTILVASGVYTSNIGAEVLHLSKNLTFSGGWDSGFTSQIGLSTIDAKSARRAVFVESGVVASFDRWHFLHGYTSYNGGAVYSEGILTIKNSLINDSTAGWPGINAGAVGIENRGTLTLVNSTVSGNKISISPMCGTVCNYSGSLTITNSTISGNTGGGNNAVYSYAGNISIFNTTITNNDSGIYYVGGSVTFENSILAGNTNFDCSSSGNVASQGFNLIQNSFGCTLVASDIRANPILGPLQDNGGPTPTHALLPGSPAINASDPSGCKDPLGNPLLFDQRGFPRYGRCDIGSFEANSTIIKSVNGDFRPGGKVNYQIELLENPISDTTSVIVTDTLPAGITYISGTLTATYGTANVETNAIHWNGTVLSTTEVVIQFGALISDSLPLATRVTNTASASFDGRRQSASTTFQLIDHLSLFLPLCSGLQCPDFTDDFSDPTSGWIVVDNTFEKIGYVNGEYQIQSKQAGYIYHTPAPTCDRQSYSVEADARWEGTPGAFYGLVFSLVGNFNQYYMFVVNTDVEAYALVYRDPNANFTPIIDFSLDTVSPAILTGSATNHLKVQRLGNQIILAVNGTQLASLTDSSITGLTGSGVVSAPYEETPISDARFDNFQVSWMPNPVGMILNANLNKVQ